MRSDIAQYPYDDAPFGTLRQGSQPQPQPPPQPQLPSGETFPRRQPKFPTLHILAAPA